jgi:hypothetical protein
MRRDYLQLRPSAFSNTDGIYAVTSRLASVAVMMGFVQVFFDMSVPPLTAGLSTPAAFLAHQHGELAQLNVVESRACFNATGR